MFPCESSKIFVYNPNINDYNGYYENSDDFIKLTESLQLNRSEVKLRNKY